MLTNLSMISGVIQLMSPAVCTALERLSIYRSGISGIILFYSYGDLRNVKLNYNALPW